MNDDVILVQAGNGKWYTKQGNTWLPVSFKLAGCAWRAVDNDGMTNVVIRIRQVEYYVSVDPIDRLSIHLLKNENLIGIDTLNVPRGHPTIKFFQMTYPSTDGTMKTVPVDLLLEDLTV